MADQSKWLLWRRFPRRSYAKCNHGLRCRAKLDFPAFGWCYHRRWESWGFQAFYFDNNEGGCTDAFFFDQNTGVVSGILFNGRGAIARTTDGGMNWSTSLYDQGMQGIDFPTTDIGFAVGWAGRILNTTDSGVTWSNQTSGTSVNLNDVSFGGNALTGIAVGDSGTILRTTNGGQSSPTPTPTPTAIPTATLTPSATPTATPRPIPTPRSRPTPAPRPTPLG